ncbi:CBS domain-containing protein [Candidatus Saganbacteria bacterium]|uniref:CBS domain-containing protein n=1 Tax=Candidatus Saganbacteria bacterium TaxID=2575572 RepID=A0A9D6UN20_UNCSA|nr:CBS domain-containing protein [Candidatus Saganbacteria bacterium]
MVLFSEMFATELIGDPVVDRVQENIGRVKDIIIALGETFPKVVGLLVRVNAEEKVLLIGEIDLIGKKFVSTRSPGERVVFTSLRPGDVLLQRDVIDQQVVDLEGARVIRVNDLKLAKVDLDVRLTAVDVGLRGILRRIGLEGFIGWILSLFKRKIPEQLIGWDHVQNLAGGKISIPTKTITDLHPADVAQVIYQVRTEDKTAIFAALSDKTAAEALHELEPLLGAVLLAALDTKKALGIIEKMPVDEAADIIGDLPAEKAEELLRLLRVRKAAEIRKLLKHRDETAGGLMTTEFIILPQNLTVEQTIARLRETAPSAETIYYLYVVDETEHLVGVLSLRSLIVSPPEKSISEIMIKDCITVSPEMNQREAADVISKYNLLAVPVVDAESKIIGIITVDDVMDLILPPVSRRKRQMIG